MAAVKEEVPPDQPIQIDVGDEEEVKTPETKAESEKAAPEPPVQEEPESALRERLKEQVRAEVLAEEARKRAEAESKHQQDLEAERQISRENYRKYQSEVQAKHNATYEGVQAQLMAAQAEVEAYKRDLRAAKNAGDIDAEVEAQARLAEAGGRIGPLENAKLQWDAYLEQQRNAPPPRQQQYQDPFEARIANLAEPAKQWFRQHREYATDPTKSAAVVHQHHQAVAAGHRELSPEYFEYVETALGLRQKPEEGRTQKGVVVSAPVTREAPSSNGQRGPTKIELTPEERDIAYQTRPDQNMTRVQAETLYARNKLRLINEKKNGSIQ